MTADVRYVPGRCVLLGGAVTWLFLDRELDADVLDVLWPAVRDGVPVPELVRVLVSVASGVSFPDFCLVHLEPDAGVRLLLRGSVVAEVDGRSFSARGLLTWLEAVVPAPRRLRVGASGATGPALPWGSGVTLADSLSIQVSGAATPVSDVGVAVGPDPAGTDNGWPDGPAGIDVGVDAVLAAGTAGGAVTTHDVVRVDVDHPTAPADDRARDGDGAEELADDRPGSLVSDRIDAPAGADEQLTGGRLDEEPAAPEPLSAEPPDDPDDPGDLDDLDVGPRPRGKYDHVQEDSIAADAHVRAERLGVDQVASTGALDVAPTRDGPDADTAPASDDDDADVDASGGAPAPVTDWTGRVHTGERLAPQDAIEPAPVLIAQVPDFASGGWAPPPAPGAGGQAPGRAPLLRLPNGDTIALDRAILLGRDPAAPAGQEQDPPHLIKLANPERDISGTHVEVRPDGEHVLVVDRSRNGTHIVLPGRDAERLPRDEPVPVPAGTQVYLNETVFLTVELSR